MRSWSAVARRGTEPGVAKEASFDGGYSLPDHVHKQIVDKVYQNTFINNDKSNRSNIIWAA